MRPLAAGPRRARVWAAELATALLAASAAGVGPAAAEPESTCVTCHEVDIDASLARPVPEWRESVHAARLVSCDGCHGGDPRREDASGSMSPQAGFLPAPDSAQVADHCGICHDEIAESHVRGRFGVAIASGIRAPSCTTCHMQEGHRVRRASPEMLAAREACDGCPGVDDAAVVARLAALDEAEQDLRARMAVVEARGVELSDFDRELDEARRRFATSLHAFDDGQTREAAGVAAGRLASLAARLTELEREVAVRLRLGFWLVGSLAVLLAALLVGLRLSR
jgi:hypothetical protein